MLCVNDRVQICCADLLHEARTDSGHGSEKPSLQPVRKHRLRNRDEDGAAERLAERQDCRPDGDISRGEHSLHRDDGELDAHSHSGAQENLVADPLRMARVYFEGCHEACAGGCKHGSDIEERDGVTRRGDAASRDEREDHHGEHERETHNARVHGRGVLDRLEPDGEVVDDREVGTGEEGHEEGGEGHGMHGDDARRHHGVVLTLSLDGQEGDEEHAGEDEEGDDAPVGPGEGRAAPLEGKQEADDGREESDHAQRVHVLEEGFGRCLDWDGVGDVQKLKENYDDNGTDGQVDVEAACA